MSQAEDLAAYDQRIRTTKTTSAAAYDAQQAWNEWYANLGFFEKNLDADVMALGKRKYTDFMTTLTTKKPVPASGGTPVNTAIPANFDPKSMPTIRKGTKEKEATKVWQRIIGALPIDGIFGSGTEALTKKWQKGHNLVDDGVVGQVSWNEAGKMKMAVPDVIQHQVSTPAAATSSAPAKIAVPAAIQPPAPKPAAPAAKPAVAAAKPAAAKPPVKAGMPAVSTAGLSAAPAAVKQVARNATTAVVRHTQNMPLWQKIVGGFVLLLAGGAAYEKFKNKAA